MSIRTSVGAHLLGLSAVLIGCARDPVAVSIARLKNPDVQVRRAAAHALDEKPIGDERLVAALAKSSADTDPDVRYASIEALGKLGSAAESALPALKSALADREKLVRLRAALSIARVERQEQGFQTVIITAMHEGDGRTLLAIGARGADAAWATPTLIGLLSHESFKVRALAAKALGSIGPAAIAAKPALEAAQRDSNPAVVTAVKTALSRIATKPSAAGK